MSRGQGQGYVGGEVIWICLILSYLKNDKRLVMAESESE
jgi:hypothetical protein